MGENHLLNWIKLTCCSGNKFVLIVWVVNALFPYSNNKIKIILHIITIHLTYHTISLYVESTRTKIVDIYKNKWKNKYKDKWNKICANIPDLGLEDVTDWVYPFRSSFFLPQIVFSLCLPSNLSKMYFKTPK